MMVNYKVQSADKWKHDEPGSISGHFLYGVVETTTDQLIESDMTQAQAKSLCRHLNFGGGFDGNTPAFFLQKCKVFGFSEENSYK